MHRQAESAANRLESLLRERNADRTRLAEVQQALQEAMQHLEDLSDEGQVLSAPPCTRPQSRSGSVALLGAYT